MLLGNQLVLVQPEYIKYTDACEIGLPKPNFHRLEIERKHRGLFGVATVQMNIAETMEKAFHNDNFVGDKYNGKS